MELICPISPQSRHTVDIVSPFRVVLEDRIPAAAFRSICELMPDATCNGYWYGRPGLEQTATA